MKYLINLGLAALMATHLTGCIVIGDGDNWDDESWKSQQRENRELISELELQTDRKRVITRLGAPNFSEAFVKEGQDYRVLYYRTQHRHSDGDTTKDETTPLVFKNDKLIGWGHEMLDSVVSVIDNHQHD